MDDDHTCSMSQLNQFTIIYGGYCDLYGLESDLFSAWNWQVSIND